MSEPQPESFLNAKRLPIAIILSGILVLGFFAFPSASPPPPATPIVNAHASNHIAGRCSSSDGNFYATGFGVDITPTHTGGIFVSGQLGFATTSTSFQVANFKVYESENATIPNCNEIPSFGFDQAIFICSYDALVPANGGNDFLVPVVCSNNPNCPPFCSNLLTLNQPAAVYFAFQNSAGGGYTLTFSAPSGINVQEV